MFPAGQLIVASGLNMGLPLGPEFLAWSEPAFNAAESCERQSKGEHGEFPPKSSLPVQRDYEFRVQMSIPSSLFTQFECEAIRAHVVRLRDGL